MIKPIYILITFLLLTSFTKAQIQKTDLLKMNVKGKVKLFNEIEYNEIEIVNGGDVKGQKKEKINKVSFNTNGNIIEDDLYGDDGKIEYRRTYKYDHFGKRIEIYHYTAGEKIINKEVYKYDGQGNMIEKGYYKADNSFEYNDTYKYDNKSNLVEEDSKIEGSSGTKFIYKYDDKSNIIEENRYDSKDGLYENVIYTYDSSGNKIEESHYKADGSYDYKFTYKYNEKGDITEENMYKSDESSNGKSTYKYYYDKNLNWIKKIEISDDPVETPLIERVIVYF